MEVSATLPRVSSSEKYHRQSRMSPVNDACHPLMTRVTCKCRGRRPDLGRGAGRWLSVAGGARARRSPLRPQTPPTPEPPSLRPFTWAIKTQAAGSGDRPPPRLGAAERGLGDSGGRRRRELLKSLPPARPSLLPDHKGPTSHLLPIQACISIVNKSHF